VADDLHSEPYRSVVRNLRAVREDAGMSQTALCVRLGKADNYISRIESAERSVGIVEIVKIGRALGIPPEELFARIIRDVSNTGDVQLDVPRK
jgi:transcriptional regulator with XRE-family HTH domain